MRRGSDTTYGIEGSRNASLSRKLDALEQTVNDSLTGGGISAPLLCAGGFYIAGAEERLKRGVQPHFCVEVPAGTARIKTVIIKVSDAAADATYHSKRKTKGYEITDGRTHLEYLFELTLDYATAYRLIRVVAIGEDGSRSFFPATEQLYNDSVPAAMLFTTPEQFGAPGAPALVDLFTDLDPTTPEYDAYALLTQHAPTDPITGLPQTYRVSGTSRVQAILERAYPAGVERFPFGMDLSDTELDAVDGSGRGICKIKATGLHPGGSYTWTENSVHTSAGLKKATGSVVFNAAHQATNLGLLTNTALTVVTSGEFDSKQVQVNLELTQPSGPTTDVIALKNFTLKLKRSSVTNYDNIVDRGNLVQADAYHQVNLAAGTIATTNGSPTITGTGTDFTKFQEGWKIKVGAQTLVIAAVASATSLTTRTNSSVTASAQTFTVVIVIPLKIIKVKPNITSYNLRLLLRGRASTLATIDLTFATGASGEILVDTTVPTGLAAPVIDWTAAGRLRVRGLNFGATTADAGQFNTLKKKWLLIYDGVATYLDLNTRTTGGSLAGSLLEIGLKSQLALPDVKKKIFKTVFGVSGNFKAAWFAENEIGLSAQSPDSNTLNVANNAETLADDKDAVAVVDVGVLLNSPQQMLTNGDWLYNDGAGVANAWRRYTVTPALDSTVSDSSANDIYWDKDNHAGIWKGTATRLMQSIKKRLKKGQFYSLSFLLKTDGAFGSGAITVSIVNPDDSTATATVFTIDLDLLTSSYQLFGGTIQLDTTSDYTNNKFLKLETAATLSATNNIIVDAGMMCRGKVVFSYTPRSAAYEGDTTNPGTTENINLTTINNVAAPDLGNPTAGVQGGFDPTGDLIRIGTYA